MGPKLLSLLGMTLLGDGATFLVDPRAQARVWHAATAPRWYRRSVAYFETRPALCRLLAAGELLAGGLLVARARRMAAA